MEWEKLDTGGTRLRVDGGAAGVHRDWLREEMGRGWFQLDIDFLVDRPRIEATALELADLTLMRGWHTPHNAVTHGPPPGGEWIGIGWAQCSGHYYGRSRGEEIVLGNGEAILVDSAHESEWAIPVPVRPRTLRIPRSKLLALVPGGEDGLVRKVDHSTPALRLLQVYFDALMDGDAASCPQAAGLAADHLCELAALAITNEAVPRRPAATQGLCAARRVAMERFIEGRLANPGLSARTVARSFGCSSRTVQRAFHHAGRSFGTYVRERRLLRARSILSSAAAFDHPIGDIALRVGFGDLSHFNRDYRARFGETPSDTRARTRH